MRYRLPRPQVIVGMYRRNAPLEGSEVRQGIQVAVHPSFVSSAPQLGNDVALILLDAPASRATVAMSPFTGAPACLPACPPACLPA